jgi:hypothetical protein
MKKLAIVSAAFVALLGLVWSLSDRASPPSSELSAPSEDGAKVQSQGMGLLAEAGQTRYLFSYQSNNEILLSPADKGGVPVKGQMVLEGALTLGSNGAGPAAEVRLHLTDVSRCALKVAGQAALDESNCNSALVGPGIALQLGAQGQIESYAAEEGASSIAVQTLRVLAQEIQLTASPDEKSLAWSAEEEMPQGRVQSQYKRKGEVVTRTREEYTRFNLARLWPAHTTQQVNGNAEIVVREGHIQSLKGQEKIRCADGERVLLSATTRIELMRRSHESGPIAQARLQASRPLHAVAFSDGHEKKLLEVQAEGMTPTEAMRLLGEYANGGKFPDHNKSLWRMNGVMQMHPELSAELVPLATVGTATSRGRGLVLDVLTSAGHAQAQEAMVSILESPAVQSDKSYHMLVQRLGLVEEPTAKSVDFVLALLNAAEAQGDEEKVILGAYVLGAAAGKMPQALSAEADSHARRIVALLANAERDYSRMHLIKALSNTKRPENHALIAGYAGSEDVGVRQAVARAMSEPTTEVAHETLGLLVADSNLHVQKEALRALKDQPRTALDHRHLQNAVEQGLVHKQNHRLLLNVVKYDLAQHPQSTRSLLEAFLKMDMDGQVRGAVRRMLGLGL